VPADWGTGKQDAHQRVDAMAKTGVNHPRSAHCPNVDEPVDRKQPGAHEKAPAYAWPCSQESDPRIVTRENRHRDEQNKRPIDAVTHQLKRRHRDQYVHLQRHQASNAVGHESVQHVEAALSAIHGRSGHRSLTHVRSRDLNAAR
jgi:hypothetical protein